MRRKKDWFGLDFLDTTLPTALMTIPLYLLVLLVAQIATPTDLFEGELLGIQSRYALSLLSWPTGAFFFIVADRIFDWSENG